MDFALECKIYLSRRHVFEVMTVSIEQSRCQFFYFSYTFPNAPMNLKTKDPFTVELSTDHRAIFGTR